MRNESCVIILWKNKPCSLVGRARYLKAYMHVISVRRNVAPDDKIAACCHIDIVSRLELPVSHVVLFHVHKGCVMVRFAEAIPISADVNIIVYCLSLARH